MTHRITLPGHQVIQTGVGRSINVFKKRLYRCLPPQIQAVKHKFFVLDQATNTELPIETDEDTALVRDMDVILVKEEPVTPDGRWFAVPDALGPGVDGYVNDYRGIRHTVGLHEPRPSGVDDDELWIDVELNQQVLQLWKGDELVWFTLVSTGAAPMGTPRGVVTITDKMATKTMRSRPDADDQYMVEDVPWTIHWRPSYAIHGAYWHWGFGRTASHGCINMAPRDVKTLWTRIGPEIPPGWHTSWATEEAPGTVLQIRRTGLPTPDKRPAAQVAAAP